MNALSQIPASDYSSAKAYKIITKYKSDMMLGSKPSLYPAKIFSELNSPKSYKSSIGGI